MLGLVVTSLQLAMLAWVLQGSTVVSKPIAVGGRLLVWLRDLRLQCLVDTLTLGNRVVKTLGAVDGLHCHVWREWHTLVNVAS